MKPSVMLLVVSILASMHAKSSCTIINVPGEHEMIQADISESGSIAKRLDLMPLAFTENQGQWDEKVKFRANAGGAVMWFTGEGIYHQFTQRIPRDNTSPDDPVTLPHDRFDREPDSVEQMMIKASFVGANPSPEITGEDLMGYKCNYFLGNDPAEWRTDVPNYQAVCFEEIYPGIDLKYYGGGGIMEYDFIVSPGADPSQIRVQYDGAKSVFVDDAGRLVIETEWGSITERKPYVYQIDGDSRKPIDGEYTLFADNSVGFALSENYDPDQYAVIDPVIVYSTYLGGSAVEFAYGIAVDDNGCAYVTGKTWSADFPTENPYQPQPAGERDVFISKLSSSGSSLIYSTYLGGNDYDFANDIAVDNNGNAYVTGQTYSLDFPTENAYQPNMLATYHTAFVAKINSEGNGLVYSTYLGGSTAEEAHGIVVDVSGNAYVVGMTSSTDFPTVNPYQTDQYSTDVFVTKFNGTGSNLIYSTYLGGSYDEHGYGIAIDGAGCAYVTGVTSSLDFPTVNPFQPSLSGYSDAFVTKFSSAGNSLIYSTYLGGVSADKGQGIAVDDSGCAYVTGETWSTDFPTQNPVQSEFGGSDRPDAFVTKLSSLGNTLIYSTFLGGSYDDSGYGIAVDTGGCAVVTGIVGSSDFPIQRPFQNDQGEDDAFVVKLDNTGSSLRFSSYLGGVQADYGYGIAIDAIGYIYLTGNTQGWGFPTKNPYQATHAGDRDAYVVKIEDCDDLDMDWVCDYEDNCLDMYNPDQQDSDEDGLGDSCDVCPFDADNDIDGDTVCGDVDNCPDTSNPDQLDSDEDEVGDACDICPYHALDDCCNPVGMNEVPTVTSVASETTATGQDFVYEVTATDPNCDGSELNLFFIDYPSWLSAEGNTLSGRVECHYEDTTFKTIASDGDLADTLEVSLTIDKSNVPPIITDTIDRVDIASQAVFEYYPTIDDPDDVSHTISYLSHPHWCGIQNDSVVGVAPDTLFVELLTVEVRDYCHSDTLSFIVSIYFCGDADGSGEVDIDDVVYLINYIFASGPPPDPAESGDADCSGGVDIDDVVYLIAYIFSGGPEPCSDCP